MTALKICFAVYGKRQNDNDTPVFSALAIHGVNAEDGNAVMNLAGAIAMDESTRPDFVVAAASKEQAELLAQHKYENPAAVPSTDICGTQVLEPLEL